MPNNVQKKPRGASKATQYAYHDPKDLLQGAQGSALDEILLGPQERQSSMRQSGFLPPRPSAQAAGRAKAQAAMQTIFGPQRTTPESALLAEVRATQDAGGNLGELMAERFNRGQSGSQVNYNRFTGRTGTQPALNYLSDAQIAALNDRGGGPNTYDIGIAGGRTREMIPAANPMSFAEWKAMQGYQPGDDGIASPDPYDGPPIPGMDEEFVSAPAGGMSPEALAAANVGQAIGGMPGILDGGQQAAALRQATRQRRQEERAQRRDLVAQRAQQQAAARRQRLLARRSGQMPGVGGIQGAAMQRLAAQNPAAFLGLILQDAQLRQRGQLAQGEAQRAQQQFEELMGFRRQTAEGEQRAAQERNDLLRQQVTQQGQLADANAKREAELQQLRAQSDQLDRIMRYAEMQASLGNTAFLDAIQGQVGIEGQVPESSGDFSMSPSAAAQASQAASAFAGQSPEELIQSATMLDVVPDELTPSYAQQLAQAGFTPDVLEDIADYRPWLPYRPPNDVRAGTQLEGVTDWAETHGPMSVPWSLFGESWKDYQRRYRRQAAAKRLLDVMMNQSGGEKST